MINSATPTAEVTTTPPANEMLAKLRPLLTLVAATLAAAGQQCPCKACRLLQDNATDLIPLIMAFAGAEPPK